MQNITVRCRAIIVHDGKLLLVKHADGRDFYAFPGGHLDYGEDPVECIRRELFEELGVIAEAGPLRYVHTYTNKEGKQSVEFFFEIMNGTDFLDHADREKTHGYEIEEVVWVTKTDTLPVLPEPITARFKAGKLLESEEVIFVKV